MPSITMDELVNLQFFAEMVSIPDEVYLKLAEIRQELQDEGIRPSDRRFKQSLSVLQAKALIEQRQNVIVNDIVFLENALWETPDQKELTSKIVRNLSQDTVLRTLESVEYEAKEIQKNLQQAPSTEATLEAAKKIKVLTSDLEQLLIKNPNRDTQIQEVKQRVAAIQKAVVGSVLDPIN